MMKKKSEMKLLYFWVKISDLLKINLIFFCNLTGKVFEIYIYSFRLSCFKFDTVFFNLHTSCRVYL